MVEDEIAFSLHVSPNAFTTSGLQLTDALSYLGFQRHHCPFQVAREDIVIGSKRQSTSTNLGRASLEFTSRFPVLSGTF